jgi:hypothetical protein
VDHVVVLVSYDETTKVATFRDEVDPGFSIIPESYIRVVDTSSNQYLMKIGAVTSVAAEILDAPIPFPLSANLRYQLT